MNVTLNATARLWLALLACLLLTACAGRNFVRPEASTLTNGQTTYAEITQRYGPPFREGTVMKNDKNIKSITYAFASVGMQPHAERVTAARSMAFQFYNDVLVGYEFTSSAQVDHSDFDETRVPQIIKDQTRGSEVITLMGKPSGRQIQPLIQSGSTEALTYTYSEVIGFTPYRKNLTILLNDKDVVTDVIYTTSGTRQR